jgi:hypothetical protein
VNHLSTELRKDDFALLSGDDGSLYIAVSGGPCIRLGRYTEEEMLSVLTKRWNRYHVLGRPSRAHVCGRLYMGDPRCGSSS